MKFQNKERDIQKVLSPQILMIKSQSQGAERHQRITNLYKRYSYHPIFSIRSSVGLLVQVPFLMAAYFMLSNLSVIQGQPLLFINDLSKPDALFYNINVLPLLITLVNCISIYFYPSDNGQKGKIQLYLMALFFLVILYTAPSALIIYWTFNNLLSLFKNLLSRISIFNDLATSFMLGTKIITNNKILYSYKFIINKYFYSFLAVLFPLFVVLVGGGINLFINNMNEKEFNFPFSLAVSILLKNSLIIALIIALVLLFIPRKHSIYQRIISLIIGIGLAFFIQGNILVARYAVLDGTTSLETMDLSAFLSIINWLSCIIISQIFYSRISTKTIITLLSLSMISPLISIRENEHRILEKENFKSYTSYVVNEDFFNFSKQNNIILIILDSVNGKYVEEIFEEPEYKSIFDGFYWFKDFSATAVTTILSVPQIYGADAYDNTIPFKEYIISNEAKQIFKIFKDNGYTIKTANTIGHTHNKYIFDNLIKTEPDKTIAKLYLLDLIQYSFFPHHAKKDLISNTKWDFEMLNKFKTFEFKANNNNPLLLSIHLRGGHSPAIIDDNFNKVEKSTPQAQYKSSFKMMKIFLDKLKSLGSIYDNSTIVITSDHTSSLSTNEYTQYVFTVIKPSNSNIIGLEEINTPLSSTDIKQILLTSDNNTILSPDYFESIRNDNRFYMKYNWLNDWNKEYMPPLRRVQVFSDASDPKSYKQVGEILTPAGKKIPINTTYTFPDNYDDIKDFIVTYWEKIDIGLLATNDITRWNNVSFTVSDNNLSDKYDVIVKTVGTKLLDNGTYSQDIVDYTVLDTPYHFDKNYPKNYILKNISIINDNFLRYTTKVSLGDLLEFNNMNTADRRTCLLKNWSTPESWGTWSLGNNSSIELNIASDVKKILIDANIALFAKNPFPLTISFNGVEVYNNDVTTNNTKLALDIPAEVQQEIENGSTLLIDFNMPAAASPKELGLNTDTRILGIGLKSIELLGND